jgi:hypothetical protein
MLTMQMYINSKLKSKRKANYFNIFLIFLNTAYQLLTNYMQYFSFPSIKTGLKYRRIFVNLPKIQQFLKPWRSPCLNGY